ncbi:MAG: mobilization protein BmgB [Ferruginibacter sp.]|nr:mobilization protein BmgB [Ferruginibacter sp.]
METVRTKRKKAGRPVKEIKKEVRACVRFSNYEYYILKEKASQAGLNISEYLRQTAIKAKITSRLTTEELHFVRQLAGISNNLNQVAKVFNQQGLFEGMKSFENYRNMIDGILQKLKS